MPQTSNDPPASNLTFGTTVVLPAGLRGTIYAISEGTSVLPDFEHGRIRRLGEIWTNELKIPPRHWRDGFPGLTDRDEWFAIDYQGRFWVDARGRYTFALISDDGARLYLDDIPVIDNDCIHSPDIRVSAVELQSGVHRIRVSYFQGPRDCLALLLAIAGPDQRWKIFSTEEFRPPPNPENLELSTTSGLAIVPVSPREASTSVRKLLHELARTHPSEKHLLNAKPGGGCISEPVRYCAR